MRRKKTNQGFATIPTILILCVMIIAVALGISVLSFTEVSTVFTQQQSNKSYIYAEAGARDALMRVTRNKNYTCATTDCYSLDLVTDGCADNDGCARVSVSSGAGTVGDPKIIISKGTAGNNTRKVEVEVIYDASENGEIATTTWSELVD